MNLAKFLKGCTTIRELMDMPNRYSHTLYKQYVTTIIDSDKSQALAKEEANDALIDEMDIPV